MPQRSSIVFTHSPTWGFEISVPAPLRMWWKCLALNSDTDPDSTDNDIQPDLLFEQESDITVSIN